MITWNSSPFPLLLATSYKMGSLGNRWEVWCNYWDWQSKTGTLNSLTGWRIRRELGKATRCFSPGNFRALAGGRDSPGTDHVILISRCSQQKQWGLKRWIATWHNRHTGNFFNLQTLIHFVFSWTLIQIFYFWGM